MNVRELTEILGKHDPETPILILVADYDIAEYRDLRDVREDFGEKLEYNGKEWFLWNKQRDGCVKVLVVEG